MGSIGELCCCQCEGDSNTKTNMEIVIDGGLHPQSLVLPIRDFKDVDFGLHYCIKADCATPNTTQGTPTISFPGSLIPNICCGRFGWITGLTEGASTSVGASRVFERTSTISSSGLSFDACHPGGPGLPWQRESYLRIKQFTAMLAKRVIDAVHITMCPVTGYYGTPEWQVTADVCWRVINRHVQTIDMELSQDIWRHSTTYNPFTAHCDDPTIQKCCGVSCNFGLIGDIVVSGCSPDLATNCAFASSALNFDDTPIDAVGSDCATSGGFDSGTGRYDRTTVYFAGQRRVIRIPMLCALPDSRTFPYSSLVAYSGAYAHPNPDITVGWTYSYTPVCDYDRGTIVETGDRSSFTVYEEMTEPWILNLT